IPLNELSAPASGPILVWVERIRAARPGMPRERWHWPEHGPAGRVSVDPSIQWDTAAPDVRSAPLGNKEAPLEVGSTKTLPPLEGGWNEAPWKQVPAWKLLRDEPSARLARTPTEVKLLHDGKTLAVFARCSEPGGISAAVRENDGPVNQDDSFHVY